MERRPAGSAFRDVVVHPGAVTILPVLADGSLVLIQNHRVSVGRPLLELCAGTLEPGERPERAAARELVEETGFSPGTLTPLGSFYSSPGITDEKMFAFLATDLEEVGQRLEPDEDIGVVRVSPEDLDAAVRRGEIEDAKILAVLSLVDRGVHHKRSTRTIPS